MATAERILSVLVLFASGVGAYRTKEGEHVASAQSIVGAGKEAELAEDATAGFCSNARCSDYTDKDDSSKYQLKFRYPDKNGDDSMTKAEVAKEKGYDAYDHGVIHQCQPITGIFSYSKDWAKHMQSEMQEGNWPNNPNLEYSCMEMCKLKRFNANGEQLNAGNEEEVAVSREGHSGDIFASMPFIGWSPPVCSVANKMQSHWWKEQQTKRSTLSTDIMVDTDNLPVFPFMSGHKPGQIQLARMEKFWKRFCELDAEQKESVVRRVTTERPDRRSYGTYYGEVYTALKARNFFPEYFPSECESDGWNAMNAKGVCTEPKGCK